MLAQTLDGVNTAMLTQIDMPINFLEKILIYFCIKLNSGTYGWQNIIIVRTIMAISLIQLL